MNRDGAPEIIEPDGLVSVAMDKKRVIEIADIPDNYLNYGSSFGSAKPKHLVISPLYNENNVNAVMELGFVDKIPDMVLELLKRVAEPSSIAVRSAEYRNNLRLYLEETQRQAEELQAQGEELRVSNEELEEQSKALQESQALLEQQQAELEQTNSQLEEQTQALETQRDNLAQAKAELQLRARELEQASQYKSDFLANMSHELRTPLNSTLILAKLLADNAEGNLTDEQVKYANTIRSSGNDLLTLINDILDLSKIEAGHMTIEPETVNIKDILASIKNSFEPVAANKSLALETGLGKDVPKSIVTDPLRLEQILKNLISNAIKFTEKGGISIRVKSVDDDKLAFSVSDTGIGIPEDKLKQIFLAFHQADGTTSRKFGGTGLGLSISRELGRLLGADITVESKVDEGSVFTITLPVTYSPELISPRMDEKADKKELVLNSGNTAKPIPTYHEVEIEEEVSNSDIRDDRNKITGDQRLILIVEDDESFSNILCDLAHDMGFECLIAETAEEALQLFDQYKPHAILLDVNLPDHSGLSVLDHIKQDPRTRHVPIHVMSSDDYSQAALTMGAMGFLSKPVNRDDLQKAMTNLETRLEQSLRRILIVEDNKVQRDSVKKLLEAPGVEIVGVGTAQSCLKKLQSETFDCMILDLSLPDKSGFDLLEQLSEQDAYSFPPVIVYTGQELTPAEEHELSRYSKSIIIKGARSPERLLDEVTLFLHKMVTELRDTQQKMIRQARNRDAALEDKRILVVEDDIRNIYSLTSILEPKGAKVEVARNGREAVDFLEDKDNGAVDLVLMDIMMPEMDGYTAMRKIRMNKDMAKLPIIALTAKAMKDDQQRCLDAGANDYMAKPLDVDKLLSLVRVWITR